MIIEGWVDWAIRIDGIPDKVWSPRRAKQYVVNHSIEGNLGPALVPARFLSMAKDGNGNYTADAQASVTFVLHKDGRLIQMYDLTQSPWTSGSRAANEAGVAIETEGVAGELLNDAQVATYVRLIHELTPWFGFELSRAKGTIKEHRELAQTACPSGRYQSAYDALAASPAPVPQEDDDVTAQEQITELNAAMVKREEIRRVASDPDLATVEKAHAALVAAGLIV